MRYLYKPIFCLIMLCLYVSPAVAADETITENSSFVVETSLSIYEAETRKSSVKVETEYGYGSGTYVIIANRKVVITAAHVVKDSSTVIINGENGEKVIGDVIYLDTDNDFAVIKLPKMKTRKAVRFNPSKRQMVEMIGLDVFYSGFPKHHELLTIRGSVAGSEKGYLILQSYAWMGASGSGVFDLTGKFIGILVAVDVGSFNGNSQLIETIVWIIPIRNIETRLVRRVIIQKIPL